MKLRIYKGEKQKEEKPTAFIRLREDSDGDITLILCNENGREIGSILTLKRDGTLFRYLKIVSKKKFEKFGFKFDDCDRIKDVSGDC